MLQPPNVLKIETKTPDGAAMNQEIVLLSRSEKFASTLRDKIEIEPGLDQAAALALAEASDNVRSHIEGRTTDKVIFVPDRLLNLVVT